MSLLLKDNQSKSSLPSSSSSFSPIVTASNTTTFNGDGSTRTRGITLHKYPTVNAITETTATPTKTTTIIKSLSASASLLLSPSSISEIYSSSLANQQSLQLKKVAKASASSSASGRQVFRTMPSIKIMSYQNIIAFITVLVCGLVTVNGLKCYMCGQYNEGVGSITPCLNYSEQYAHLYLKECSKKSEKYCVKYVSELSIVRDCATECAEKEIWETQTYCCTEDGCNGATALDSSAVVIILPLIIYLANEIINKIKQQYR